MTQRNGTAKDDERPAILPSHVAIIMDGNGRWAEERGLSRIDGHRAGTDNVRGIIETCLDWGIPVLTLFAFSTENWHRPEEEIDALFELLSEVIDREIQELKEAGVRVRHLGTLEGIPSVLAKKIRASVAATKGNRRLTLNVAFNYGGRAEIVRAVQRIVAQGLSPSAVDDALISAHLDTAGLPDPDLIIRTAGEMRLSNFLLWQAAYAEYWCTEIYWPDLTATHFRRALYDFSRRQRRFGGLSPAETKKRSWLRTNG